MEQAREAEELVQMFKITRHSKKLLRLRATQGRLQLTPTREAGNEERTSDYIRLSVVHQFKENKRTLFDVLL